MESNLLSRGWIENNKLDILQIKKHKFIQKYSLEISIKNIFLFFNPSLKCSELSTSDFSILFLVECIGESLSICIKPPLFVVFLY